MKVSNTVVIMLKCNGSPLDFLLERHPRELLEALSIS